MFLVQFENTAFHKLKARICDVYLVNHIGSPPGKSLSSLPPWTILWVRFNTDTVLPGIELLL